MHILPIILLFWLGRYLYSRNTPNSPSFPWCILLTPILITVNFNIFNSLPLAYGIIACIPGLIVCAPSLFAQISIRLGMVKISFYLGRLALGVHRKDSFGGALFYGWKALKYVDRNKISIKNRWLTEKLMQYKGELKTGGMIIQIFLKENDVDEQKMLTLFENMDFGNQKLIPGNIYRYAFRWGLARELGSKNWEKIGNLAFQWYGAAWNPLAAWIVRESWVRETEMYSKWRLGRILYYACAGFPRWKKFLPSSTGGKVPPSLRDTTIVAAERTSIIEGEWWYQNNRRTRDERMKKYWEYQLDKLKTDKHWVQRCSALGAFDHKIVLDSLANSVKKIITLDDFETDMENSERQEARDKAFKLLNIKVNAINQRVENKTLMSDARELEEWYAIVAIVGPLLKDSWAKSQAFYIMRDVCWQWVADLWNGKKSRASAYIISGFLSPLAAAMGDEDSRKVFSGIINNEFE